MREWRNRQTRTFEGRVGDRTGSIPVSRTKQITPNHLVGCYLFLWDNESNPSLECLHSRIGCAFLTEQRLPLASNLVGKNSSRERAFPSPFLFLAVKYKSFNLSPFSFNWCGIVQFIDCYKRDKRDSLKASEKYCKSRKNMLYLNKLLSKMTKEVPRKTWIK